MAQPKRILIVEDDIFQAELYERVLAASGYQIKIAKDGLEALEKASHGKPDLILLDIMLPKLNGVEVLRRLRQQKKTQDIPVFLLSNLGQGPVIQETFRLGARDYLLKATLLPQQLVTKINTFFLQEKAVGGS